MSSITHPFDILFGGGVALSCAAGDGQMLEDERHGLFAGDTRVLATYRLTIAGQAWRRLARERIGASSAQWDLENPAARGAHGELEEGKMHLRLRRRVDGAMHDCLVVSAYADHVVRAPFALQIDADFADVFEVEQRSFPARLAIERLVGPQGLLLRYRRGDFERGLEIRLSMAGGPPAIHVGSQIVFDLVLAPGQSWRCCLEARPIVGGARLELNGDPHARPTAESPGLPRISAASILADPFRRGQVDLARLACREDDGPAFIAAGAPWFMALFGRDGLVATLMAGLIGSWSARGILAVLGRLQAERTDTFRDEEPGKLAHELRHGELVHFGLEPHSPYYGAHDAPALYVLALWHAYRWTGDRDLLEAHLGAARRALAWCDGPGDGDADGLLEYQTRSRVGYANQGWKDSGDAICHADGTLAEPPVATVELQGYLFAARLAMAELFEAIGDPASAEAQRRKASALRRRVEERFWMPSAGTYALALDGQKGQVASIASNAGHLLLCGLPTAERAAAVARRLLAPDMFSGYGLRTLSAEHPRWNPLSYHVGSVWPHDSVLVAAGLFRYRRRSDAARILRGVLDAAAAFEHRRLPELFCGFSSDDGAPVPYEMANSPQAWAAAAPLLAAQLFLGLLPDAASGRLYLDPWLPEWLPILEIDGIEIGDGRLRVALERRGDATHVRQAEHERLEIVRSCPEAPLWGAPPGVTLA